MRSLIGIFLFLSPQLALACGGLFCNNTNPVNQAAERILFAPKDDGMDMHVRITYAGPPSEFGWLLPVPADVEYGLSSEQLFSELDRNFAPTFVLRTEFDESCRIARNNGESIASAGDSADAGLQRTQLPSVQVLPRSGRSIRPGRTPAGQRRGAARMAE